MFLNYIIIYVIDIENEDNLNTILYAYAPHNTRCKKILCYSGDIVILKHGDVMIESNFIGFM